MRRAALLLLLAAAPAQAQPRPDTTALTCREAGALVAQAGAIVLSTGPTTYERVVRDVGFCTIETSTRPAYEPTRDVPNCFVGYRCVDPFSEGRGDR